MSVLDPVRVLHFSLSDLEGGAARAAFRLHAALLATGHHSRMLVRNKVSNAPGIDAVAPLRPWPSRYRRLRRRFEPRLPEPTATFNFDVPADFDHDSLLLEAARPDVLCLHRITRFLTVREIHRLHEYYRCPLVWIILDQQPVTGGCHYSLDCDGFTQKCGRCPQLRSDDPNDRSRTLWLRKREHLLGLPLTFVAPSTGALDWLRRSSLFSGHPAARIPLAIDGEIFRPLGKRAPREILRIPAEAKVVFLGANALDVPRKGAGAGLEALRILAELAAPSLRERLFLLAVGDKSDQTLAAAPLRGRAVGRVEDELTLALMYQAADVFLSPSIADAGPMMVPEALLCGTPVVAFALGYARDLLETGETGGAAPLGDTRALAALLHEVLRRDGGARVAEACRNAALPFEARRVADAYAELFRSLREGDEGPASPRQRSAGARSTGARP